MGTTILEKSVAAISRITSYNVCYTKLLRIIIVVSNPLDVMTYAAFLAANKAPNKVFGMAGTLDTGRYKAFIASALNVSPKDIHAMLLGGHGDTRITSYNVCYTKLLRFAARS